TGAAPAAGAAAGAPEPCPSDSGIGEDVNSAPGGPGGASITSQCGQLSATLSITFPHSPQYRSCSARRLGIGCIAPHRSQAVAARANPPAHPRQYFSSAPLATSPSIAQN